MRLTCFNCKKEFERRKADYNRQLKIGKINFYCSLSCAAIQGNKDIPRKGNPSFLNASNKRDLYTPYRWFILRANSRDKNHNLTLDNLKMLFEKQHGVCPLTGCSLNLPLSTEGFKIIDPYNASLDRIDCNKGYLQDNIRFISVMANYARNVFSDEQLIEFCKKVASNND